MRTFSKHSMQAFCRRNLHQLAILLALGMAFSVSALAQSGAGAIQGTVKDSTGAVIAGALVDVVDQDKGQAIETRSNDVGYYSVPSLFTGNYTLTFSAAAMKKFETSISLQVGQTAVINPMLSMGSVTEQVTVSGNAVQLATYDNGTISSTLENSRINQLPVNGRNLATLAGMTTPGLEAGGTRANGNMNSALEYVQDGAPLVNRNSGGATRLPDPDAVQEVRMETATSSAQFATPATGIITTKSGTNSLHGSFFETMRNNYIGIAKARQDPSNLTAPHLVRNEFGGSVGGPIIIPKLYNGKDRSFFFIAYERFSLASASSNRIGTPTVAMRNGDWSGLVNGNSQLQVLYDNQTSNPVTYQRQPFLNNQIPMSRLSPLAKTLYAITPLPTSADNPLVSSNLTIAGINNQVAPTITGRLDHTFNQNNRAYLRYTYDDFSQTQLRYSQAAASLAGAGLPAGATNLQLTPTKVDSFSFGFTHVFSPTFFAETVLSNEWEKDAYMGGGNPSANYEQQLGLPNNFGMAGFPSILPNGFMTYTGTQFAYSGSQIITNVDENLSKTFGRHQMQFGGRYRHERLGVMPDQRTDQVNFTGQGTGVVDPLNKPGTFNQLANTGNLNADFFIGAAQLYQVNLEEQYLHYRDQEFDTYFQDNFHMSNKLTVNLGLRWEAHPAATEKNNQNNSFDLANHALVLGQTTDQLIARGATTQAVITNLQNLGTKFESAQQAGLPPSMVFDSNFTFSPRLGVAYTPFGSRFGTVIRAGLGRYIYPIPLRNYYSSMSTNAPFQFSYNQDYQSAAQSPDGLPSYLLRMPQTVVAGLNSANVVSTGGISNILPGSFAETYLNPHFPPNYVSQGNVTIEQPLKGSSVLRLSYVYDHGTNLDQMYNVNSAPSDYVWYKTTGILKPNGYYSSVARNPYDQTLYGTIQQMNRNGWSNDNAFQANFQRLYKAGYAYQVSYVYSRAFRVGGNTWRDSGQTNIAQYAPGMAPVSTQGMSPWGTSQALNRFQNYGIDTAIPEHHILFNGIVDIPVGRGKHIFRNANRIVDELIGGYQIAGSGNIYSEQFQPGSGNWGGTNPIQMYKHAHPITDCRSGVCHPAYQYFNGYISPLVVNNPCGPNLITGLASNYVPYSSPLNMDPGTVTCSGTNVKTSNSLFGGNSVIVPLTSGSTVTTGYSPGPGLNPFTHTFLQGPWNNTVDLSMFKVFPITETVSLRVNMDAFNAFNVQGYNNPGGDGIESIQQSHNTPRQVQFSARLSF